MIQEWIEEMHGSDRDPDLKRLRSEPLVGTVLLQIERNGALFRVHGLVRLKKT